MPVLHNEWREPLRAQRDPLAEDHGRVRSNREEHRQLRKQSWLGRFISTYGWRAYALPVLIVITAVVVYQTVTGTTSPMPVAAESVQGPPTIGAEGTAIVGAPPRGLTQFDANLPTGILPDGGPFTEAGRQDVARGARDHPAGRPRNRQSVPLQRRDRGRGGHHLVRRRRSDSPGWSTKRWATPRAGPTIRSSPSFGWTRTPQVNPISGCR